MNLKHLINLSQSHLRRLGELIEPELYLDYYDADNVVNSFTQMPQITGSVSCKKRDSGEPSVNELSISRHFLRYKFLSLLAYNKNVLDYGCGCGYGSYILGSVADKVVGLDLDDKAIAFANKYNKSKNIEFFVSNYKKLDNDYNFDLIISVETFEHIKIDEIDYFITILSSMLKDGGIFALTTPLFEKTIFHSGNDFINLHSHYAEYNKKDFIKILERNNLQIEQYVLQKFDGSIVYNIPKKINFSKNMGDLRHWVQIAICKNEV